MHTLQYVSHSRLLCHGCLFTVHLKTNCCNHLLFIKHFISPTSTYCLHNYVCWLN